MEHETEFALDYSDGFLTSKIGGKDIKYAVPRNIELIKKGQSKNRRALAAVHESGHAIAYMVLFNVVPTQLVSSASDMNSEGFMGQHHFFDSKTNAENQIIVNLAGRAAEQAIFGEEAKSSGASSDIMQATGHAGRYFRKWGMNDKDAFGCWIPLGRQTGEHLCTFEATDTQVESFLKACLTKSQKLIADNLKFLKSLSTSLLEKERIMPVDLVDIAKRFDVEAKIQDVKDEIIEPYYDILQKELKTK